ncbi:restriction endonuclease subunit S [Staphylococcus caledonicus]|uniref:restriction endonuclease subunit S n=1 Tax=Staphylococcus sp. acrmy TaxID=2929076 RepID=UPI001F59FBF6|nr:restriction endonuclease subunit S [Staphylococcus sp. acrmy]MCI2949053.1 restriction endonuclease subunit S [Staphylococcus sp. acrmy]
MINEPKNVPELRFPGFDEEWKLHILGECVTNKTRKFNSKKDDNESDIELDSLESDTGRLIHLYNSTEFSSQKNRFKKGDVLYSKLRPYLNKYYFADFDGVCSSEIWVLNSKDKSILKNKFLYSFIQTNKFSFMANKSAGSKMPRADWNLVENMRLNLPTVQEQQKIGTFFNKLDRQIELEEQKLEKLKEQKKGYMQQIFSRQFLFENEKGDTDYSWRNFKINDIFSKIESGNRLPKTNLVEGNIPYVIAQTTNNGVFMHISEDTLDYHKNKLKLFKKGSITISIDNPEAMFIQEMDFFTSNVMRVIHNENLKRGSHIFIMESLKKLTQSYNWSVKFSGPIIMDSTVKFPVYNDNKVNWNVVNKIGDFFNTFEIRINRQSDKIKLLEERKKGFLQKMFV